MILANPGLPTGLTSLFIGAKPKTAQRAAPLPHDKTRVHFFAGSFETKDAARHYCFYTEHNRPEDLTRELPEAFIDTAHVEVVFGGHSERLSEFLDVDGVMATLRKIDQKNTLVMIAEPAFGGFPYLLDNTSVLTYLGAEIVDI